MIGTEFGIVVGIILAIFLVLFFKRKKSDNKIAEQFTNDFKEFNNDRKVNLEKVIEDAFQLGGEATEDYAKIIMNNEKKICGNVLKIFSGKDRELLLKLQDDLANLTDAYQSLAQAAQKSDDGKQVDSKDVERLRAKNKVLDEENERLKEDLKKSLESIDYLQAQYAELSKKTNKEESGE